ncbi:O-antigen ligase WaaL [Pseudomonas sp. No.21]|uniref:O-antigen ligase family protein n=1 Tax=Pseudomonas TaxID=286 RepID=UPI001F368E76|nr:MULTISPECIES: O-antigen ligase family protein [Pseudomonas]MDW3712634.1 O-antigen ligase family protein [Pseudomonas sp. 2023EL-01195]GJN44249.1 putative lipopolysaccharide biosynthesis protein [Pseudomonas tohonis]
MPFPNTFFVAPAIRDRLANILECWLLLGLLVLLTGLFWTKGGSQYTKLFYGLFAVPALLSILVAPHTAARLLREPTMWVFPLLCLWLLTSLYWSTSDDDISGLGKRPFYVLLLFVGCAFLAQRDELRFWNALHLSAALGALAALVCLVQFFTTHLPTQRLVGTGALSNPLLTSHVLGFLCTFWLSSWLVCSERHNWVPVLMFAPLFAALIATGSRTPMLGLTAVTLFMLVRAPKGASLVLAFGALGALVSVLLYPDILLQRGLSFRPELWMDALRQASEHPILGYGYDTRFAFDIPAAGGVLSDPHNVELAVLLELGAVGLCLWFAMYGCIFQRCFVHRHQQKIKVASALVIYGLAAGMTEGSSFLSRPNESWFIIWIPLAITVALTIRKDRSITA